jgi:hypothetical protein
MAVYSLTQAGITNFVKYTNMRAASGPLVRTPIAGYAAGGSTSGGEIATVSKFLFSTDVRSTLGTGLDAVASFISGFADSGTAGYTSRFSAVNKFAFPSDSRSVLATGLSTSRSSIQAFSNTNVAGYFAGGSFWNGSATVRVTTVDKYAFPADSRTVLGTGLSVAQDGGAGFANFGVAGYAAGGFDTARTSRVQKVTFPTDSMSTLGTGLSVGRQDVAGAGNVGTAGYAAGGARDSDFAMLTVIDKFAFPSDTRTVLSATLTVARRGAGGWANSGIADYFAGGNTDGVGIQSVVDKLFLPAETVSALATGLPVATAWPAGMANEGQF